MSSRRWKNVCLGWCVESVCVCRCSFRLSKCSFLVLCVWVWVWVCMYCVECVVRVAWVGRNVGLFSSPFNVT